MKTDNKEKVKVEANKYTNFAQLLALDDIPEKDWEHIREKLIGIHNRVLALLEKGRIAK